jgi:hypothetical protein
MIDQSPLRRSFVLTDFAAALPNEASGDFLHQARLDVLNWVHRAETNAPQLMQVRRRTLTE